MSKENSDLCGSTLEESMSQGKLKFSEKEEQTENRDLGQTRSTFAEQRDEIAEGLGSMARILRNSAQQLQHDQKLTSGYINSVVGKIEHVSDYLREKDMRQFIADIECFARRRPGLFLAGAFALGFFSIKLLKSAR
jgi:hypothetical protein